jgi:hypothetical protein
VRVQKKLSPRMSLRSSGLRLLIITEDIGMPELPAAEPLDSELAAALGQIVYRWSALEYWISLLLTTLLKADHGAMMIVTGNIAISVQSKWIRGLLSGREREGEQAARVTALLDRADDLRSERNEFVHGLWDTTGCEPRTAEVQTVNLERTEVIRSRLVTIHDLNELVIEINEWIADYIKLGRELGFPRRPGETESILSD